MEEKIKKKIDTNNEDKFECVQCNGVGVVISPEISCDYVDANKKLVKTNKHFHVSLCLDCFGELVDEHGADSFKGYKVLKLQEPLKDFGPSYPSRDTIKAIMNASSVNIPSSYIDKYCNTIDKILIKMDNDGFELYDKKVHGDYSLVNRLR